MKLQYNDIVGLTKQEAIDKLEKSGLKVRVVAEDGKEFMRTMESLLNRVNLKITNGVVTEAYRG